MPRLKQLALAMLALSPGLAWAHHGQDFLLLESPAVPHPGDAYLIAYGHAAIGGDAEERAGFEPAFLIGVSPRVALELHAHSENLRGEGWAYEATAPSVHVLLTDPARHEGLKVAISAEYEIAAHADGADNAELRLSFENGSDADKWAANLIASREQGGDNDLGAALGYRHEVHPGFAFGVEGQGSFRHAEGAQLLAAVYFESEHAPTIKLGLGGERDEAGKIQPMAHVGLVVPLH